MGAGRGHLFIVRANLLHLSCDAWLLPTDRWGRITDFWSAHPAVSPALSDTGSLRRLPEGWEEGTVRTFPLQGGTGPRPWATRIGGSRGTPTSWYVEGLVEFLDKAAHDVSPCRNARARPLLALPLVGTGFGGQRFKRGGITETVVATLLDFVSRADVDVVLVLDDPSKFSAAQAVRWRAEAGGQRPWASLADGSTTLANDLGAIAAAGRLTVFFGAGASAGAGLPSWQDLLAALAREAGLTSEESSQLERLDFRDQARIIADRMQPDALTPLLEKLLTSDWYSLTHALLANLPSTEYVTTNYDTLFEAASADAGCPVRVLPYEHEPAAPAWLLKLHGSVGRGDLVLTRSDYMRQMRDRSALAGIVQALLITRHMLFVGYSLRDEDFLELAHDVREAVGATARPIGTALDVTSDGFLAELWKGFLHVEIPSEAEPLTPAEGARFVEVLLDRVLAEATRNSAAYFLDPTYWDLLTEEERLLGLRLRGLLHESPNSPIAAVLERMRRELGYRPMPRSRATETGSAKGPPPDIWAGQSHRERTATARSRQVSTRLPNKQDGL